MTSNHTASFTIARGDSPVVATAIHEGHEVRAEVASRLAIGDDERRREEDPYTGRWTHVAPNRVVVHRSRFEVDLNRPRDQAIYLRPEQAWGLRVWDSLPSEELVGRSLEDYDNFYHAVGQLLGELRAAHGGFVVLDLHSYNHRRAGADGPCAPWEENPEINVGTGTMDRQRWRPVVERFLEDLRAFEREGRRLDVRENVRFRGGYFPRWIHENFPDGGCALAIEVKKFYIDEWTGRPDEAEIQWVYDALASTLPGLEETLASCAAVSSHRRRSASSD